MDPEYAALPVFQVEALRRYIVHGLLPGHFLTAVLENNLREAVARADDTNQALLPLYVQWLVHRAPAVCWGSPQLVVAWATARRLAQPLVHHSEED